MLKSMKTIYSLLAFHLTQYSVRLMARRNPAVMTAISKLIGELTAESEQKKEQKKRRSEAGGKGAPKSKKKVPDPDEIRKEDDGDDF